MEIYYGKKKKYCRKTDRIVYRRHYVRTCKRNIFQKQILRCVMSFLKATNFDRVWANICKYEGEIFFTQKRKTPYTYTIKDDYIVINNNTRRGRITKEMLKSALLIEDPIPSKIGGWAPSYICGIITDYRII